MGGSAIMGRAVIGGLLGCAGALILGAAQPAVAQNAVPMIMMDRSELPEEYVVEPGDTLWELCEYFYRDPWLWPTVWALNPHVTNPHWIYPGDLLRLKVPPQAAARMAGGLPALSLTLGSTEASHVSSQEGFITEHQIESVGVLHRSPYDARFMGDETIVYLKLDKLEEARPGDRFSIYRTVREVTHPTTGRVLGEKVLVLGIVEVLQLDEHYARAKLVRSFQEMERGDRLMPLRPYHQRVSPKQNLIDLEAVLVDELFDLQELGQTHMVFIDRGERDGVQVGNRLFVMRRWDGHLDLDEEGLDRLPVEQVGEIMVLETQERSATALVTRSTRELRRGDRLLMERNY